MYRFFVVNQHGAIEGQGYATHREALGFMVKMMKCGWDTESWHIVLEGSSVSRGDAGRDVRTEPRVCRTRQPNARASGAKCASALRAHTSSSSPGESV